MLFQSLRDHMHASSPQDFQPRSLVVRRWKLRQWMSWNCLALLLVLVRKPIRDIMLQSDSPATKRAKYQSKAIPISDESLPTLPSETQLPVDGKPEAELAPVDEKPDAEPSLQTDGDSDGHKDDHAPSGSPSAEPSAEEAPSQVLRICLRQSSADTINYESLPTS